MTDYQRIKDPVSGAEYTYDDAKIDALGLSEHVIDKPALGPDRLPAPVKPRTALGEPLPGSQAARKRAAKKSAASPPDDPQTTGAPGTGQDAGQTSAAPEGDN